MAIANKYETITLQALENLNTHQFQAVALDDGKVANNGNEALGILINKPKINEHATLAYKGICKSRAGGAIAIQKRITVSTSGYFTQAGSGYFTVGRALKAVTSGSIGTGVFDFTNPQYAVSSADAT